MEVTTKATGFGVAVGRGLDVATAFVGVEMFVELRGIVLVAEGRDGGGKDCAVASAHAAGIKMIIIRKDGIFIIFIVFSASLPLPLLQRVRTPLVQHKDLRRLPGAGCTAQA